LGSEKDGIAYITDRNGNPNVFNLNWNGEQLKLNGNNAKPSKKWNSDNKFVFRFRKSILFPRLHIAVFLFRIFY
jgi:Tol biopolymer transport system component